MPVRHGRQGFVTGRASGVPQEPEPVRALSTRESQEEKAAVPHSAIQCFVSGPDFSRAAKNSNRSGL